MEKFPNGVDHIVAFIFCILLPFVSIRQHFRNNPVVQYSSLQKRTMYFSTCISLFIMAALVLSVWLLFRRPPAKMGLTLQMKAGPWAWLCVAFVFLYAVDAFISVATPRKRAAAASEWKKRTPFMPVNNKEFRHYLIMCLCAGIFEEVVYRGYMVTYFSGLFDDSSWRRTLSVWLPALVFSVSHFYHDTKTIIKVLLMAVLFGYIYVLSGSLVMVMLLHFLANAISGWLSVKYMKDVIRQDG